MAQELDDFDAPDEIKYQMLGEQDDDLFLVNPDNWDALQLFLRLRTQWRVSMSGPVGLDHGVLFALMDRQGIEYLRQDMLQAQVLLIEQGALLEMKKRADID